MPDDVRKKIADRLYEDRYLCVAALNIDDNVEPSVSNGGPDLLVIDGIELKDRIQAVRADQEEVEKCLDEAAAQKQALN